MGSPDNRIIAHRREAPRSDCHLERGDFVGVPFGKKVIDAMVRDDAVGTLIVDDIDNDLIARLEERAAAHGRSAEAEHREILRQVLARGSPDMPFGDMRGKIWMARDFDETSDDILDAMESDIV